MVYARRRAALALPMIAAATAVAALAAVAAPAFGEQSEPTFTARQSPVPPAVAARMREHSWHPGCPTAVDDLTYLQLSYVGFDGGVHQGELVVHRGLAADVVAIFRELFALRFPIEKMRLIDEYAADDDASMADNNTSAFNCRPVAGKPGVFSKHSSGRAVDINPRINPMFIGKSVFPPGGASFADRNTNTPGLLKSGDPAVQAFVRRGWTWGGAWRSLKDYQHFEK